VCGMAGYLLLENSASSRKTLGSWLSNSLCYVGKRGPDSNKIIEEERFGLCHARLRIIDTSSSSDQPLSKNDLHLVFNGEIYNYVELGRKYLSQDYLSDSVFLLDFLLAYGHSKIHELRGMFSFLLFDSKRMKVLAARDPLGQKPFFYSRPSNELFLFSQSELHLASYVGTSLSTIGLEQYQHFQTTFAGNTLFERVQELPPGHVLLCSEDSFSLNRYWYPNLNTTEYEKVDSSVGKDLLVNSVARCLVSDVPIALIASGGLDSSIVTGIASSLQPNVECFHGFFTDTPEISELAYAQKQSKFCGIPLREIELSNVQFVSDLEATLACLESPAAGLGSVNQFAVSREISKQYKVVIGGQGGDEIFMGYARYFLEDTRETSGNILSTYGNLISKHQQTNRRSLPFIRYIQIINRSIRATSPEIVNQISDFTFKAGIDIEKLSFIEAARAFDQLITLPSLLKVEDRTSMHFGLEGRVPLIDVDLVAWANGITATQLTEFGPKSLLKDIARDFVDSTVINRTDKMGFPLPSTAFRDFIRSRFDLTHEDFMLNERNFWGEFSLSNFYSRIGNIPKFLG
jgi:asparagine synthase (glutamine-hydrolysing)